MNLLEALIGLGAPHLCVGCGCEGAVLCASCARGLPAPADSCYRCARPSLSGLCSDCHIDSPLYRIASATSYAGLAKTCLWRLKFGYARQAATDMAGLMADRFEVAALGKVDLITHAPTAPPRIRQRGYDQAQLLARGVARRWGLPYRALLQRSGVQHQHGADRAQRRQQLGSAFAVGQPAGLAGRRIGLVDDVLTTGATLEAAALVLLAAGAQTISAITFARTLAPGSLVK